ncbi:ATP-dependent helicase hrpA [Klebsiella pneumoniae]|uniref:ATP-dependent helicase hrpA n=1 Tax=Klebsiella pneumoniae TaxID=573 RepID=A0A2X3F3Z3_KLEPN|nr:ATP-dependent helicase hrpA [Klebsiella pneumoniae]
MAIDPHRDRAQMLKVESVQQAWQQWLNKLPPNRREDDDVREIRWMIEELRVSFFAQQLGTPYPISGQASVAGDGANYPIAWLVVPGGAALTGAYWSGVHA